MEGLLRHLATPLASVTISHMERAHGGTMGPAWHMYLGVAHTRSLLLLLRSIIFTKYNRLWLRLSPCIACGFVVVTFSALLESQSTSNFVPARRVFRYTRREVNVNLKLKQIQSRELYCKIKAFCSFLFFVPSRASPCVSARYQLVDPSPTHFPQICDTVGCKIGFPLHTLFYFFSPT